MPPPPGGQHPAPFPPPPPPAAAGPAIGAPANPTVARFTPPVSAATPVTPSPAASHAPSAPADGGATQYIVTGPTSSGDVVGVLVGINGELKGEVFKIGDGENRLGRSAECEIELASQKISRMHAMLIHQEGTFVIKPLNDKNPTFLNEAPTEGDELGDGDTIRLGASTLKFRSI